MKRILLFANKTWECEPILNALLNNRFSDDAGLLHPQVLHFPFAGEQGTTLPRAVWTNYNDEVTIELWCVQDIMKISDPTDKELFSSSQIKKDNIPRAFNFSGIPPDLVIALGTAGYGVEGVNAIGCIVMGSKVFIHNFHPNGENEKSVWDSPEFEKLIPSKIQEDFFAIIDSKDIAYIESRLLKPFLNPSLNIEVIIDNSLLSLSTVNITNYKDYDSSDQVGSAAVRQAGIMNLIGSVETTHGIIRLASEAPFVFVSGITDRAGHFADDVNGKDPKGNQKTEAQNYAASFNIGVFLAKALPKMVNYLKSKY